jgi:predicted dehydrogenase
MKASFAIAGFGGRGKIIGRKLHDLGFDVPGVYDSNPAQLVDCPFRTFTELDPLLKLNISALVVASWPQSHADIAERALDRGVNVFVEKPMGATLEQSQRIVNAQRRSGRLVIVGYVERVNQAIIKLRELADLTEAVRSREIRIGLGPPVLHTGGVLSDLASHGIDIAYHLFHAEPKVRSAILTAEEAGRPEYECIVELEYGHTRSLVETRRANIRRRRLEVDTDHEYYEVNYTPAALKVGVPPPKLRTRPQNFEDLEQLSRNMETTLDLPKKEPMKVMLELLGKSVTTEAVMEPLCNGEEALVTAKAIDEARKIAQWRFIRPQV